jgi:hypothetical protein
VQAQRSTAWAPFCPQSFQELELAHAQRAVALAACACWLQWLVSARALEVGGQLITHFARSTAATATSAARPVKLGLNRLRGLLSGEPKPVRVPAWSLLWLLMGLLGQVSGCGMGAHVTGGYLTNLKASCGTHVSTQEMDVGRGGLCLMHQKESGHLPKPEQR